MGDNTHLTVGEIVLEPGFAYFEKGTKPISYIDW
jgi:hypothetical protein